MMHASLVFFNHDTGVVTVEPFPSGEKITLTEDATRVEFAAADDVKVRADAEMSDYQTLSNQPLIVRENDGAVTIRTARKPDGADAAKPPEPGSPADGG